VPLLSGAVGLGHADFAVSEVTRRRAATRGPSLPGN
jgi:hypothetical protein